MLRAIVLSLVLFVPALPAADQIAAPANIDLEKAREQIALLLRDAVEKVAKDATVKLKGKYITVSLNVRDFEVARRDKIGRPDGATHIIHGPTENGFVISAFFLAGKYGGQMVRGRTPTFNRSHKEADTDFFFEGVLPTFAHSAFNAQVNISYGATIDVSIVRRVYDALVTAAADVLGAQDLREHGLDKATP